MAISPSQELQADTSVESTLPNNTTVAGSSTSNGPSIGNGANTVQPFASVTDRFSY